MTVSNGKGIIDTPSNHSVDQTVEKLKGILEAKGVTLFALVDHSGEAAKAGMKMRPTKLLIFESLKAATPVAGRSREMVFLGRGKKRFKFLP